MFSKSCLFWPKEHSIWCQTWSDDFALLSSPPKFVEFPSNSWEILSCFCQSFVSLCIWQNFFHNWQKIFCCWQNCFSGWQNFFRIWQNITHVLDWFDRIPQKFLKSIKLYKTPIQMIILKNPLDKSCEIVFRNFCQEDFSMGSLL